MFVISSLFVELILNKTLAFNFTIRFAILFGELKWHKSDSNGDFELKLISNFAAHGKKGVDGIAIPRQDKDLKI